MRVLQALRFSTPKLSQLLPEWGAGGLHVPALRRAWYWQERNGSRRPSTRQCVLPAERFGEVNPYTQPTFPLASSKDQRKNFLKTGKDLQVCKPQWRTALQACVLGISGADDPKSNRSWETPGKEGFLQRVRITECRLQGSTGGGGPIGRTFQPLSVHQKVPCT